MMFSRLCSIVSQMPHHLTVSKLTHTEALEVWAFLDTDQRIPYTEHMLRRQLCNEMNCFMEVFNASTKGTSLAEILTWEAGKSSSGFFTDELINLVRNAATQQGDWILDLCKSLTMEENELLWRWATRYRWRSVRYRMIKWLKILTELEDVDVPMMLNVVYGEIPIDAVREEKRFTRLKRWETGTPEVFWFVTDCSKLSYLERGIARYRNGDIDVELTPQVPATLEPTWCWVNPNETGHWHASEVELTFSLYKEPLPAEWHEGQQLLNAYPKSGFLILDSGDYHLYTAGTASLNAQLMSISKIDKHRYRCTIGFRDGIDSADVLQIELRSLPFNLEQSLRRRGVNPNIKHVEHEVRDCLVLKVDYTWGTKEGWHFRINETKDNAGITEVDEIVDYIALVGEDTWVE